MARQAPLTAAPPKGAKAVTPVQKKLSVGPAHDRYEAEADRIADRAVSGRAPAAAPAISRLPAAAVQRKAVPKKPDKTFKTKKIKDKDTEKEDDKSTVVQRSADGPAAAPVATENAIGRMRAAGGRPLTASVRQQMETGIGRPMRNVRVHDGAGPARAAKSVGARAFTVGNDVFFGAGQYRPETPGGQRLLAHELVHTVQQQGLGHMAQTTAIQRDPEPDVTDDQNQPPPTSFQKPGDRNTRIEITPDGQPNMIFLPWLEVPKIDNKYKGALNFRKAPGVAAEGKNPLDTTAFPFVYKGKTGRGSDTARQQFLRNRFFEASETRTEPILTGVLPEQVRNWNRQSSILTNAAGEEVRYLRLRTRSARNSAYVIYGTTAQLADHELIKLPNWGPQGNPARFDVDHSLELQLGGFDGWENFWLLDQGANRSSGSKIHNAMKRNIDGAISAARSANFWDGRTAPSYDGIRAQSGQAWQVSFNRPKQLSINGNEDTSWSLRDIMEGRHLRQLVTLTETELVNEGLITQEGVTPQRFSIFASPNGGFRQVMNINNGNVEPRGNRDNFFFGFNYRGATINTADPKAPYVTHLTGELFQKPRGYNPMMLINIDGDRGIPILSDPSMGYSGYVDNAALKNRIKNLSTEIAGASPVTFQDAGINAAGQIYGVGTIAATKALFPNLQIPIYIEGSDIFIEFPIPTESLSFGPVTVTEAALRLGVGDNGVFVEGRAGLEVDQLGSGGVEARVERGNVIITGTFNFDLDFLDPAQAEIVYNYGEDTLSLTLNAGIQDGVLPGVQSGQVTATFTRDQVDFGGSLTLGGALSGVVVSVTYSAQEGLSLGADNIQLPVENIPGVSGATASLYARQNPDTREWSFGGQGTASLDIAGATGEITIGVDGDKVLIGGNLAVAKGPASGSISFTATNAPLDDEGNPIEGEATENYTVFGRGDAEMTFGSILRGTAGIELTPQASIIVSGSIGLPPTFEVFPRRDFNKTLLEVETPDFPIWGVSVGGVGVGIFAFADANLSFNAFVGPGMLVDTQIGATLDLDRPEDAEITGSARFTVPAYAGMRLDIGGGLRARATVAFVEGRVGLEGELGIAADASAAVDVAWNRTDGLSVEAEVEANAQPKFRVGVNASVTAGVDLLLTEVSKTWGPWRKTLGEFGPDMAMGVTIPVAWNEHTGMDFSIDDIEVRQPQINVRDILKSSFEELV